MLVQWPRASAGRDNKGQIADHPVFEEGSRRTKGSVQFVAYDPYAGGWEKRAIDVAIATLTAPIWGVAVLGLAIWAKERHGAPVFLSDPRIGYGGRSFKMWRMRLSKPVAEVVPLRPDVQPNIPDARVGKWEQWRPTLERLPVLFNVLMGQMSFVGPRPRDREALDRLGAGKKFYMSARPGVLALTPHDVADEDEAQACKQYTKLWMLETDADIVAKAWRDWRPPA